MNIDIFPYLVVGLAEFMEKQERSYPYPDSLRYSLNKLSLAFLSDYPKTIDGLLQLFTKPLDEWWPGESPSDFDPDEPLIENSELSFEAITYLERLSEKGNMTFRESLSRLEVIVDNMKFRQLLECLREKYLTDPAGAQREYVFLKRFIIEHPYSKLPEISQTFSQAGYINATEVSELYLETNPIAEILQYPNLDGHKRFWLCEHCGPLRINRGRRESIKQSACGKHCPRHQDGWKEIIPSSKLGVLRKGIHLRVLLPGIPEISLFNWLEEHQQRYPELMKEVLLWPGIDKYDLQIRFANSVWAIDVKDYEKPHQLGRNLTGLYREGNLHWDNGFYVYPAYREKQRRDYGEAVRHEAAPKHLQGFEIVNDEVFKNRITHKLKFLRKEKS